MVKICCLSDIHGNLPKIPPCDLLLIAGDICPIQNHDPIYQARWLDTEFRSWLNGLPCKVVGVAGNHDFIFEKPYLVPKNLPWMYLEDNLAEVDGLRIWGSPWQPYFYGWAFNLYEPDLAKKWEKIPDGIDILLLHGPPHGYGDLAPKVNQDDTKWQELEHTGSPSLTEKILSVRPKLTVFGHIHKSYGIYDCDGLTLINAAMVNSRYEPVHEPILWSLA